MIYSLPEGYKGVYGSYTPSLWQQVMPGNIVYCTLLLMIVAWQQELKCSLSCARGHSRDDPNTSIDSIYDTSYQALTSDFQVHARLQVPYGW